jgi:hypothetical protein
MADAINETYADREDFADSTLLDDDVLDGESTHDADRPVLTKAAQCLHNGIPATFTEHELDLVRHLMPAHEVHQSGSVRWILENYGPAPEDAARQAS